MMGMLEARFAINWFAWLCISVVANVALILLVFTIANQEPRWVTKITIDGVETKTCSKWYHPDRIEIDCITMPKMAK